MARGSFVSGWTFPAIWNGNAFQVSDTRARKSAKKNSDPRLFEVIVVAAVRKVVADQMRAWDGFQVAVLQLEAVDVLYQADC